MKLFKKIAAVVLAAAVVLTMLAGCGKKYGTPEQEILKKINEARASTKTGLEPLSNDSALAAAAGALLDAFAKNPAQTNNANGYKLTGAELKAALGSTKQVYAYTGYYYGGGNTTSDALYIAPISTASGYGYTCELVNDSTNYYLVRRADASDVGDIDYRPPMGSGNWVYPGNYGYDIARNNKVKVGIATRKIGDQTYAMVIYDVDAVTP